MKPRITRQGNPSTACTTKPLNLFIIITVSLIAGAASWAVASLVSSTFKPWDSIVGILTNQAILCITAFTIGLRARIRMIPLSVLFIYIGLNIFINYFGSLEHQSYAERWLISTAILCILPLLTGTIGAVVHLIKSHHILLITRKVRTP